MKLLELFNKPMILYHGYSREIVKDLQTPVHFAYEKELAKMYSRGSIGTFEVSFKNPLITTPRLNLKPVGKKLA